VSNLGNHVELGVRDSLTLPITVLTLGLFLLVINALMLRLAASFVPGFEVKSFWPALWGSVLLSVFSAGLSLLF
jgi:putative membrane protein